jgi:carbonic anhydrase
MQGNARYTHDALEHPNRTQERREASAASQAPFAIIVGCADSRVSPEIIFDEGVGDLFVVRVAGNVIGPLELESVEYAALYLHSVVIVVLGHESCGAVNAVVQGKTKDIESLAKMIVPAVKEAQKLDPDHLLTAAVQSNALHMKDLLMRAPAIDKLVKQGKIIVEAAYYDLQTGAVELL